MKKIALTSLLAVFAVSGANAANVIDGNPLYMPKAGHFYSETALETKTESVDMVTVKENFGYGITDRLAVAASTSIVEDDWFDGYMWNTLGLNATYRVLDDAAWKIDVLGAYNAGDTGIARLGVNGALMYHFDSRTKWFDKDVTLYTWMAGVRGGYTTGDWTIAGHATMTYANTESFNWGDDDHEGLHILNVGVDAQLVLNNNWNLVAGADYMTTYEDYSDKIGTWELTFGAYYNFDATKYIGAYVTKLISHDEYSEEGNWEIEDGYGMGVKFGIDF